MASRAIELLRTNPGSSLFFAFGADHFLGDDSVIDLMREAGFEVERVRVSTDLNTLRSTQSISRLGEDGIEVLNLVVPKPEIPEDIAHNYKQVKVQWTEQLVANQTQKTEVIKKKTELVKV